MVKILCDNCDAILNIKKSQRIEINISKDYEIYLCQKCFVEFTEKYLK